MVFVVFFMIFVSDISEISKAFICFMLFCSERFLYETKPVKSKKNLLLYG